MPRELDEGFFDVHASGDNIGSTPSRVSLSSPNPIKNDGLDKVSDYLAKRSEMFQTMTSGRGKPMNYGFMKKERK